MQTIWELTQSCITSTITYSSEIWSPGKTENEKINRIMDKKKKRILMVPQSTPQGSAVYRNWVAGSRSHKAKKQSANGTQNDEWHKPENEKFHNKQHHHKMGWRNKKGKTRAGHRWRGHQGRKNNCEAQSKQQNKRVVQGKNRKRGQEQIQSPTPIGRDKKTGNPKRGPTIWKN